jgi:Cysteine-rich CPCC
MSSKVAKGSQVEIRFKCPCCGYRTLETAGALALCPVCWWEDDGQEDEDAADVRLTVNGQLSLKEARMHFLDCGAADPRFLPYVRKPEMTEQ